MNGYWKRPVIVLSVLASWILIAVGALWGMDAAIANQLIIGAYAVITIILTKWAFNGNGKNGSN